MHTTYNTVVNTIFFVVYALNYAGIFDEGLQFVALCMPLQYVLLMLTGLKRKSSIKNLNMYNACICMLSIKHLFIFCGK